MKRKASNLLLCIFLTCSFGFCQNPKQNADQTSVDTSFLLKVNGVEQYLEIKGASATKPVLLFIHGGPSWPATPMLRKYSQDLTKDFVLVSWDQRNCGKSKSDSTAMLTTDLYVEDAHQVTQFLKKQFQAKKIFIACHSWGTIVGTYLVLKYPEDYSAYIGIGQFVNPNKSEAIAWKHVTDEAKRNQDTSTLNVLKTIPFTESLGYKNGFDDLIRFRSVANKYFVNSKVAALSNPTQLYEDYSKIEWFTPVMTTGKVLFNYMNSINIDLSQYKTFSVPVYFFTGRFDYETSSQVVEQYFKTIKAPKKYMFWFEQSAHSPHWEEPPLFHQRLLSILNS